MERNVSDTWSEWGRAERWAVFFQAQGTPGNAGLKESGLAQRGSGIGLPTDVPGIEVVFKAARGIGYPLPFLGLDHATEIGSHTDLVVTEVYVQQNRNVDVVHAELDGGGAHLWISTSAAAFLCIVHLEADAPVFLRVADVDERPAREPKFVETRVVIALDLTGVEACDRSTIEPQGLGRNCACQCQRDD